MRLSGTTRLIALLGSPVAHSRSPEVHNLAFEALGLDYAYLAFDVALPDVDRAVGALRLLKARGANVTMPLKRAVCAHLDRLDPGAELAGAVNTIVNDDGVLTGYITDGTGYLRSLDDAGVAYRGRTMVIAGVGGAASAVAIEAARCGVRELLLFNVRDGFFDAAQALAGRLRERYRCVVELHDLGDHVSLRGAMERAEVFVNGTPLGMGHSADRCVVPSAEYFHCGLTVTDLVYEPVQTRLLQMARQAGCRTVNGLGMQWHQAAHAFRLWTGQDMPRHLAPATNPME